MAQSRKQHIAAIVARIDRAAKAIGIEPPAGYEWEFTFGSKTYGNSFSLNWRENATGALYKPFGMNPFLGMSFNEAEDSLYRIADVLEAVHWHKEAK